ncbi:MAG: signal peptidase I [Bacteroidaceae bacterium]|nr:signal peptidase I [Bacteroidaceae bacterium]
MNKENNTSMQPSHRSTFKERVKRTRTARWVRFGVFTTIFLLLIIWIGSPWLLLIYPLFFDIYITQYIPWGGWRNIKNPFIRTICEWVDAIAYALVLVYFIFIFAFQNFQIPTPSLEKSMLVGDFLLVSKVNYGPRLPQTPLHFPLAQHTLPIVNTKSYIDSWQLPYKRLKGLGSIERNDIVVFNFPAGDTVASKMPNPDYYTLAHYYGREALHRDKARFGEIIYRPVDRREAYVKRCVGLPGENFEIRNNVIHINGKAIASPKKMQLNYFVKTNGTKIGEKTFEQWGISVDDRMYLNNSANAPYLFAQLGITPRSDGSYNPVYHFPLTQEMYNKVQASPIVEQIVKEPDEMGGEVFPLDGVHQWSRADFGPLWIPQKGATIQLNADNYSLYERAIRNYEGNKLELRKGVVYINDEPVTEYTFKMDYYMMLGDNRDNSADSRYWGFVPEDHIIGKPILVLISLDKDKGWFNGKFRWNRFMRPADSLVN